MSQHWTSIRGVRSRSRFRAKTTFILINALLQLAEGLTSIRQYVPSPAFVLYSFNAHHKNFASLGTNQKIHRKDIFKMKQTPADSDVIKYEVLPTVPSFATSSSQAGDTNEGTKIKSTLRHQQDRSSKIASSFQPSRFNPHPLLRNRHVQTITGVFLREDRNCAYVTDQSKLPASLLQTAINIVVNSNSESSNFEAVGENFWDARQRIDTPDGDFFHVDIKYQSSSKRIQDATLILEGDDSSSKNVEDTIWWRSEGSKGTVLILHGLESNSYSPLSIDMSNAYHQVGLDVIFVSFRGTSGEPNDTIGGYHVGFTDDLMQVLNLMTKTENSTEKKEIEDANMPIFLSGFSLGASVVLKALGEMGEEARSTYNIHGAAVTGAPWDQERNIKCVDAAGFNREVYSANLIRTIKAKGQYQLDRFCNGDVNTTKFDYKRLMKATTIEEIDDAYIAPVYGFENNVDYWRRNSCIYFLDSIAIPTLVVNAADDPFFDPDFFPWDKGCDYEGNGNTGTLPIKLVQTDHGGHLGYMFHEEDSIDVSIENRSSWMPTELARFLSHVQESENEMKLT